MTAPEIWASIALLAFAGWMLTLGMLTRSLVPMANSLGILQKIVDREDSKVQSLAERALRMQNRGAPPPATSPVPMTGPMADVFRPGGPEPIYEQPPSSDDVEIHE